MSGGYRLRLPQDRPVLMSSTFLEHAALGIKVGAMRTESGKQIRDALCFHPGAGVRATRPDKQMLTESSCGVTMAPFGERHNSKPNDIVRISKSKENEATYVACKESIEEAFP